MNLKVNPVGVNPINFRGENNTKTSDVNSSSNETFKQNTKLMIGASALAAAVIAGIAIIRGKKPQKSEAVNDVVNNTVKEVKKSVHDMYGDELAKWSESSIEKIQKVFAKKRDVSNWNKPWNYEKPYESCRYRTNDSVDLSSVDENGIFFVEKINTKSGKQLTKVYDENGSLKSIKYSSKDSWMHIDKHADKSFWVEYCDRNANRHESPVVDLRFSVTDNGLQYKTSLRHKVRSEQYYQKEYETVSGPKPKKEKEINTPQE